MNTFKQIFVALLILILPEFLSITYKTAFCTISAYGQSSNIFGQTGQTGKNGNPGSRGRDSENMTIFVDGSPMTINLGGQNGVNGEQGSKGLDSLCGEVPNNVAYNLEGASGGDGGAGGDGGDGGDGGSVTIYTTKANYLQQIYINATGGKGGNPGKGGDGGQGCTCIKPFWSVQSCTGSPGTNNYTCSTTEYRCRNGESGRVGPSGRPGREGRKGNLTLINSNQPLTPDLPSATVSFTELKDRGFTLSRNQWQTKTGAATLFAPGSIINDEYIELVSRTENSFIMVWNAPAPFKEFADKKLTIKMNNTEDKQGIDVTLPGDVWLEATTMQQGGFTKFIVYNALLSSQATQLQTVGISGKNTGLILTLQDTADKSKIVSTKFKIKYNITNNPDATFRQVYDYRTKYEGEVASELVQYNDGTFNISVGKLPIPQEFLQPGTFIQIEIEATRSFTGYSAKQRLSISDAIKR